MSFIKSVSLMSLLALSMNSLAGDKTLAECGFPLAGEKFESNINELLEVATTPPEIPDYKCEEKFERYASLCVNLENKSLLDESDPSGLYYKYEKILADYAKADINRDGEDLFIKKVNAYITKCSKTMLCDSSFTKKEKIDLLKVAVATSDWDFIEKAIDIYKWPLNDIGPLDKMTILDFVYEDIDFYKKNNKTGERLTNLTKYYNSLKNAGAKHSKYKI